MPIPLSDLPATFYQRVWNERKTEDIDRFVHPEMSIQGLTGPNVEGRDAFRVLHHNLCVVFSQFEFGIDHVLSLIHI